MNYSSSPSYRNPMQKLMLTFFFALIVSVAGMFIGTQLPDVARIPLYIVELVLLISIFFLRRSTKIGYPLMYGFMLVSGATLQFSLSYYIAAIGSTVVIQTVAVAVIVYAGLAIYASRTKEDFRFLGGFLFASVIGLIVIGLMQFFIPFDGMMETVYSGFGLLVFIGYTLYDFNRMAKEGFDESEIPLMVVNIYLDLINMVLFALRFVKSLIED
ncbi:FtsH-binding integral membrane protein [Paenibacillus phyllosphaerae]|uniref:FtsH-binding integral membrane protein n=1 Tax=Paenibacillus phyllosphaerae TaxID=274593 RepID=A0A7W5FML3_9BACL|nr:Bax inhibitor-1 family protein [Paenibacillus phyllosphaerae]MBB3110248.1 FtsH-binding integral membrane protein [Paenibacillus phyllosphaerae]